MSYIFMSYYLYEVHVAVSVGRIETNFKRFDVVLFFKS